VLDDPLDRARRRRIVRTRNDARATSHRAWAMRVRALEACLRASELAEANRAIAARISR
jgi:hypothetical protein